MRTSLIYMSRRYPPSVGGMQRLSRELHLALAARLPVRAVTWGGSQLALPLFAPLAAIRALAWLAVPGMYVRPPGEGQSQVTPGRPIGPAVAAGEVILAGDAVLSPIALVLGRATGRPVAAIAHGLDFVHPSVASWAPAALRRADLVIAISHHIRDLLLARGIDPGRCLAIPLAATPEPLPTRRAARERLSRLVGQPLSDRPVLLTVGRLAPRKGHAWFASRCLPLIRRHAPDTLYLIAGEGTERRAIEAAGDTTLLGRVDDRTRADLWAAADLFIMPNRALPGDAEGFGLVAAEAAHAGLPVVATAVEGILDAVHDGVTGRLVPPEQPAVLAEAILALLADRGDLPRTARQHAGEHFTWDAVGDRYAAALTDLARRASSRRG